MSKAEPVILAVLLALIFAALSLRIVGRYMASSMAVLDCRLGYYGLMSLASQLSPSKMQENAEWISFNVADGDVLFSKPSLPAHPMVVRRKIEASGERLNVTAEGCAFGDKEAYQAMLAKLPPAVRTEVKASSGQ
jgi:hypothetical protein